MLLTKERWATVSDAVEGAQAYEVSTLGRLRVKATGEIIRPQRKKVWRNTYNVVVINKIEWHIDRLVMFTFDYPAAWMVVHLDGNTLNDAFDNLKYYLPRV